MGDQASGALKWSARLGSVLVITAPLLISLFGQAKAIPAFARKYNLSCGACHTKPPRLNAFGEMFHMSGFQIPGTTEGETRGKRTVGRVSLDELSNVLAVRFAGSLIEQVTFDEARDHLDIPIPEEITVYLTATLTDALSVFVELEQIAREVEVEEGQFAISERFGLGKEAFVMIDLAPVLRALGVPVMDMDRMDRQMAARDSAMVAMGHQEMAEEDIEMPMGILSHGPMLMVGKIDPSTNFSYPTNRQMLLPVPADLEEGRITRFAFHPYALGAKFLGLKSGRGAPILPTTPFLYNTEGDLGIDLHGMLFGQRILYQAGILQGGNIGLDDVTQSKDVYVMGRWNFGMANFISGSLSGLRYFGFDTARAPHPRDLSSAGPLINWRRWGLSGNIRHKGLDLYGAFTWDTLTDLPAGLGGRFDRTASGLTVELDALVSDRVFLSVRYDQLDPGGIVQERRSGRTVGLQARYYVRDNLAFYLRDQVNLTERKENPLRDWRNAVFAGLDWNF